MADQYHPRVVSLLPSATDIVAVAGGIKLLVGRSHECNWPSEVERLPVLTGAVNEFVDSKQMDDVVKASLDRGEGLYYLKQELLKSLKPDIILTQDLCNVCSVDLQLVQQTIDQLSIKPKIVALNPQKLSDVLEDIVKVGTALGREKESQKAVAALQERVRSAEATAKAAAAGQDPIKVAFVEWLDPLFVGGHWTPEMIGMAGGVHPLNMPIGNGGAGPSIRVPNQALVDADCDWIIVCPCGFTIEDTKKEEDLLSTKAWWQKLRAVQHGHVVIVDGNKMFARPGPRLVDALEFLVGLLYNKHELIPNGFPWAQWEPQPAAMHESISAESSSNDLDAVSIVPSSYSLLKDNNSSQETSTVEAVTVSTSEAQQKSELSQQTSRPKHQLPHCAAQCEGAHERQEALQRKWRAAPYLGPDIEEAHAAAIQAGHSTYVDPATGYKVITEQSLRSQSVCCANRCRHCPFGHYKVPASRGNRVNTIMQPTVLRINRKDAQAGKYALSLWLGNATDCADADGVRLPQHSSNYGSNANSDNLQAAKDASVAASSSSSTGVHEIVKPNSSKPLRNFTALESDQVVSKQVHVVVFADKCGHLLGSQTLTLHNVMDECLQTNQTVVAIPVTHCQSRYSVQEEAEYLAIAEATLCKS